MNTRRRSEKNLGLQKWRGVEWNQSKVTKVKYSLKDFYDVFFYHKSALAKYKIWCFMIWTQFCSFLIDVLWWSPFDALAYNPLIRASYNLAVQRGSSQYQFGFGELHPDESHVRHFQPQRPSISERPCWNQSSADVLKSEGWRVWVHVTTSSFRVKIRRQAMLLCGCIFIYAAAAAYVYTSFCGFCLRVCSDFSDHFKSAKIALTLLFARIGKRATACTPFGFLCCGRSSHFVLWSVYCWIMWVIHVRLEWNLHN